MSSYIVDNSLFSLDLQLKQLIIWCKLCHLTSLMEHFYEINTNILHLIIIIIIIIIIVIIIIIITSMSYKNNLIRNSPHTKESFVLKAKFISPVVP